jgi:HEAT repeat protein
MEPTTMRLFRSSLASVLPATLTALLLAPGCSTPTAGPAAAPGAPAAIAPAATADLNRLDYAGDQAALQAVDREIAAAGQDPARLHAIAQQLVAVLRSPTATYAAKQAAAQRLALFPAADILPGDNRAAFLAMLLNDQQVNLARLALDRVPGPEVDTLYAEALPRAQGLSRMALIESAGNRRIAAASPTLTAALADADSSLAAAAAKALGQIGTAETLHVLQQATPATLPVLQAQLAAAAQVGGTEALAVYENLAGRADAPAGLRAAAARAQLFAAPNGSERLTAVLTGQDAAAKAAAIEALTTLPAAATVPAVAVLLPRLDAATQTAVVTALGQTGSTDAVAPVTALLSSDSATVRAAVITALGRLPGSPATATELARVGARAKVADAKLARQSLAVLNGPGVAEAIVTGAKAADSGLRVVFIEQLASRNMAEQLPLLLQLRSDPDVAVRNAALGALADIAPASAQGDLIAWTVGATDPTEQSRALRALAVVTLRNPSVADRSRAIIGALEQAEPAVAVRLLPVLPRIGDQPSAECAARLAQRGAPAEAAAAAAALYRWPNETGLVPLITVAEQARAEATRAAATAAALRMVDRTRTLSDAQLRDAVKRLLAVATDAEVRSRLVYLLGRSADATTLAYAEQLRTSPDLATAGADAVMAIKARLAGRPSARASVGERRVEAILDGKPNTVWGAPATAGQWIEVDFHAPRPIRRLVMDNGEFNYPEHAEVFVTDDPARPGTALASVAGQPGKTTIELPQIAHGRYLIIRHTQTREDSWWGMSELLID